MRVRGGCGHNSLQALSRLCNMREPRVVKPGASCNPWIENGSDNDMGQGQRDSDRDSDRVTGKLTVPELDRVTVTVEWKNRGSV